MNRQRLTNLSVVAVFYRDILATVEKESHSIAGLGINDKERVEIVAAMGLSTGHWFKCPKGEEKRDKEKRR